MASVNETKVDGLAGLPRAETLISGASAGHAKTKPSKATPTWDLNTPPTFHDPKLLLRIKEILATDQEMMSESDILCLQTHECREKIKLLTYVGKMRMAGIKTLSCSGSKVDMQRRIVTWFFCLNRQLNGLPCIPKEYKPPGTLTEEVLGPGIGTARRQNEEPPVDGEACELVGGNTHAQARADLDIGNWPNATLDRITKVEEVNKLRRDALTDHLQQLRLLYDLRREAHKELQQLEGLQAISSGKPLAKNRKRQHESEETSLYAINQQIATLEDAVASLCKRVRL